MTPTPFASKLAKVLSVAEVRQQTLLARMEMIKEHPEVIDAAELYLNGESPMGHAIGDRCAFGVVLLTVARKTSPLKATPFAAARKMRQVWKRSGVPLLRNGKIDLNQLESEDKGDGEQS